jgi:hypothetical protein
LFFVDPMMSKMKNNELKFSIRNLIGTTSCEKTANSQSHGVRHPQTNRSLKRLVLEPQTPLICRPVPLVNHKASHPCWSFLSQLTTKNSTGNFPLNSSLMLLNKMSQVWEQIQRTQISPSIPTENDDGSDEESSIHHDIEFDDDEDECSSNDEEKLNPISNSEENDKLKNYPCTQCGKVRFEFSSKNIRISK